MIHPLKKYPWYVLLLPLFFVWHGYAEYFRYLHTSDALKLSFSYTAFSLCVFGISWIFFRNIRKAGLMTGIWMAVYLFFGAIHDFLKAYSPFNFIHRYRYLGPVLIVLLIFAFIYMKKTRHSLYRITLFLNVLFCIYLLIDVFIILSKAFRTDKNNSLYQFTVPEFTAVPDELNKPDIYFLLFDEYASSVALEQQYGFKNDIDSFFEAEGFSVQPGSVSNYNYTPFSIASLLNMSYIQGIKSDHGVDRTDFLECNPAILNNQVMLFLKEKGYNIVNFSMFDVADQPSRIKQSFLPLKTKMIVEGTLFPRLYRDFDSLFINNAVLAKMIGGDNIFEHLTNNEFSLNGVEQASKEKQPDPRFIYGHFYMPHEPFFFDEHGNRKDNATILAEDNGLSPEPYLQYLKYTNTRIRELISKIKANTNGQAAIVVLSDHGYRDYASIGDPKSHFRNLNAVYLPDKNYNGMYDSISNVNQFRVILNTLFQQQLPLLKDSTIFLLDRKFMAAPKSK